MFGKAVNSMHDHTNKAWKPANMENNGEIRQHEQLRTCCEKL